MATLLLYGSASLLGVRREVKMPIRKEKQWRQSRVRQTVAKIRLIIKHPAELTAHVIDVDHDELNAWIRQVRTYGFSIEAESLRGELVVASAA